MPSSPSSVRKSKLIMGVDIGFTCIGCAVANANRREFAVVDTLAVRQPKITNKKFRYVSDVDFEILRLMMADFFEFIRQWTKKANEGFLIVVELPTGGAKGARAQRCMGLVTGAFATAATVLTNPFVLVNPSDVKLAVTGLKNASKDHMMNTIRERHRYYRDFPKTKAEFEHVADAVGTLHVACPHDRIYQTYMSDVE